MYGQNGERESCGVVLDVAGELGKSESYFGAKHTVRLKDDEKDHPTHS